MRAGLVLVIEPRSLPRVRLLSRKEGEKIGRPRGFRIKPEALKDKTVLDFGSGSSNIGGQLKGKKIDSKVIDVDLKFDPTTGSYYKVLADLAIPVEWLSKLFKSRPDIQDQLVKLKRKIAGTEGRKFLQANGRALPFADQSFDYVLALWSTYQIPEEAKETVYRELMRVGKILHFGPIFQKDFDLISKLAPELGYEIVACQPEPQNIFRDVPFMFKSSQDYDQFMKNEESARIKPPQKDDSNVNTILGMKSGGGKGGNAIVLRRKQPNDPQSSLAAS